MIAPIFPEILHALPTNYATLPPWCQVYTDLSTANQGRGNLVHERLIFTKARCPHGAGLANTAVQTVEITKTVPATEMRDGHERGDADANSNK